MNLKGIDYSNDIICLIARMLSVHTVTCIRRTNDGIAKSFLDENMQIHHDGIVSTADVEKRIPVSSRTSWETTNNRNSLLFDDQNLTLCIRLTSPIDNLDDIYLVTIRPTLQSLTLKVTDSNDINVSIRDKEIIAAMCYSACTSAIEMIKSNNTKTQLLKEEIRHKDRTISELKREREIPIEKTRKHVKNKLVQLGQLYNKDFILSKDAELILNDFVGDNITPLLKAIERAASLKAEIYDNFQIIIDDTDIRIVQESETAESNKVTDMGSREKRHARLISYLEKIEDAYNRTVNDGYKPTAINIANAMNVTSASITMWFNKHSEDAKRLCDANINLCKNSRQYFDPLREAIAGKRNKVKTA